GTAELSGTAYARVRVDESVPGETAFDVEW
ncbi:MAG: hypothetical protein J07HB67_00825, partial [halophilic archaeon J07HB67]